MAICEKNLRVQICFQTHFSSLAFRFAQWPRKAWKAFLLVCLNNPIRGNRMGTQYICVLFSARQIPARWPGLLVCEIGRIRRESRKNERRKKRLPSLPFLTENGGIPLWAVLNFFVEILS